MIRVRIISLLPDVAEYVGEEGVAEPNPSGYPNWIVFLDCHGNDIPTYWGAHELEDITTDVDTSNRL